MAESSTGLCKSGICPSSSSGRRLSSTQHDSISKEG